MPDPSCRKCYGRGLCEVTVDVHAIDSAGVRYGPCQGQRVFLVLCDCKDVKGENHAESSIPKAKG